MRALALLAAGEIAEVQPSGRAGPESVHEKLWIAGRAGDPLGLDRVLLALFPAGVRDLRPSPRPGVAFTQLERPLDPAGDEPVCWPRLPHAGSLYRLVAEFGVNLSRRRAELDGLLHRGDEALSVVLERAGAADLVPETPLRCRILFQTDGAVEEGEPFVDLVAADGELGRALGPGERLRTQLLGLGLLTLPGEVEVLWPHRLCVVVRQQSGVFVVAFAASLEPFRERRVQLRPPCLWQARVGHFAREGVLDCVLPFAPQRRAGAPAYEVALGEQVEVGRTADELVYRASPEHAADHRRRLERRLLRRREQVDARC